MIELIILLMAGVLLAALFLFWSFAQWGTGFELPPAQVAQLVELLPLSGVSYERAERLFDARDYRFLASQARLQEAARQLERDRRQIALRWLKLLREDFDKLERFRRVLVAHGGATDPPAEWKLVANTIAFHFTHRLLTAWIHLFGLYAAPRAHTVLLAAVRHVSTILAGVLARLSPNQLAQVKQFWAARELRPSPAK